MCSRVTRKRASRDWWKTSMAPPMIDMDETRIELSAGR
jgi:hypothetical protein